MLAKFWSNQNFLLSLSLKITLYWASCCTSDYSCLVWNSALSLVEQQMVEPHLQVTSRCEELCGRPDLGWDRGGTSDQRVKNGKQVF